MDTQSQNTNEVEGKLKLPTEFMLAQTLQAPTVPPDFVDFLVMATGDHLLQWLQGHQVDPATIGLFGDFCFFGLYRYEAARNAGQVPGDINQAAPDYLLEALRCLAALGYKF